jgi:methyl-accepting chemotaxis protein
MMVAMPVQIAGVAVPSPAEALGAAWSVAGWGVRTVLLVAELPARTEALLAHLDRLLRRIDELTERADALVGKVDAIAGSAEQTVRTANAVAEGAAGVIDWASQVADGAGAVVAQAEQASRGAAELLATYQPLAERAAPLAEAFVTQLSEQEVQAAIRLVDQLPGLAEHMESDIMPILATLDRVGPDIHELLSVTKDLRRAINGIPGFAYFRRRGADPGDG